MLFYGNGIVWDKETNSKLCKFENGKFETDDTTIISKLKERYTYEVEEVVEEVKKVVNKRR